MDSTLQIGVFGSAVIHVAVFAFAGGLLADGLGTGTNSGTNSAVEVELVAGELTAPPGTLSVLPEALPERIKPVPKKVAVRVARPDAGKEVSAAPISATPAIGSQMGKAGTNGGGIIGATPDAVSNPPPVYPESARQAQQQGVVILVVEVNPEGRAESVEIEKSSGVNSLDSSAKSAVSNWKFRPETYAGIPRPSSIRVPVRFQLENP